MTLPDTIHICITSSKTGVRRALVQLMRHLQRCAVSDEDRGKVQLVLAEALNNIVEHGYADGREGLINLQCSLIPEGMYIVLTDHGSEVPPGVLLPQPVTDPRDASGPLPDNLPEGGWGLFLINELAESLAYRRRGGRNELRLHLPFSGGGSDR